MKSIKLKTSLFASLCSCILCSSCKIGDTLPEITKPYLGEYECNQVIFNHKEYLKEFDYVRLTLNPDDTFTLAYKKKGENKHEETGNYVYEQDKQELVLSSSYLAGYQRRVPLKDGIITLSISFGGNEFMAQFEQK